MDFYNRTHQSHSIRDRYNPRYQPTGEMPVKKQSKPSPFSEFGLFLLGCVATYETIKLAEKRFAA